MHNLHVTSAVADPGFPRSGVLDTPTPRTIQGTDRSLLIVCIYPCPKWSPMGLRTPALSSSQDRHMRNPIQVQLNTALLVTSDMHLLIVFHTGNSDDSSNWALQTSSTKWLGWLQCSTVEC